MKSYVVAAALVLAASLVSLALMQREPAQAQGAKPQQRIIFVPPLKEEQMMVLKGSDGKTFFALSSIDSTGPLETLLRDGWRAVDVKAGAGGFAVTLEK